MLYPNLILEIRMVAYTILQCLVQLQQLEENYKGSLNYFLTIELLHFSTFITKFNLKIKSWNYGKKRFERWQDIPVILENLIFCPTVKNLFVSSFFNFSVKFTNHLFSISITRSNHCIPHQPIKPHLSHYISSKTPPLWRVHLSLSLIILWESRKLLKKKLLAHYCEQRRHTRRERSIMCDCVCVFVPLKPIELFAQSHLSQKSQFSPSSDR